MSNERLTDAIQRERFYEIYDAILPLSLPWDKKYRGFEWLIEDAGLDLYPIDGITVDALHALEGNNWNSKGIVKRGHGHNRLDRRQRANELFADRVPYENVFEFFMEHEKVTICTPTENGNPGTAHWSEVIPLPIELFGWRSGWAVSMNKTRTAALQVILEIWRNGDEE